MYTVVEFEATKSVEYVPSCWMIGLDETYWPKLKFAALRKAVTNLREPDELWPVYKVHILGQARK